MSLELVTTSDHSHSLYNSILKEHYHSTHGAVQESKHVFIDAGLKPLLETYSNINILEIGFGTGLNVILTLDYLIQHTCKVNYQSIESFPLEKTITDSLNYVDFVCDNAGRLFKTLHDAEWNKEIEVIPDFFLKKIKGRVQEVGLETMYDLIYFDAFGPPVQPEMWTQEVFKKIFDNMKAGAILVTYCAKGEVKRTLKSLGFTVEELPGPPGKREMVRARRV